MAGVDSISGTNSSTGAQASESITKKASQAMDLQSFLKLIAAQMKNQSLNSSSTDNSQYITEMTLFSAIQAMNTLTAQSSKQYASSLIGSDVVLNEIDSGTGKKTQVTGTVTSATFNTTSGDSYLQIGGKYYNSSDIVQVLGYHQTGGASGTGNTTGTGGAGTGGQKSA